MTVCFFFEWLYECTFQCVCGCVVVYCFNIPAGFSLLEISFSHSLSAYVTSVFYMNTFLHPNTSSPSSNGKQKTDLWLWWLVCYHHQTWVCFAQIIILEPMLLPFNFCFWILRSSPPLFLSPSIFLFFTSSSVLFLALSSFPSLKLWIA